MLFTETNRDLCGDSAENQLANRLLGVKILASKRIGMRFSTCEEEEKGVECSEVRDLDLVIRVKWRPSGIPVILISMYT